MTKTKQTYEEIATNYRKWQEFFDTGGLTSEAEFDLMTTEEKIGLLLEAFGPEDC